MSPALSSSLVGAQQTVVQGMQQPCLDDALMRDSVDEPGGWTGLGHFEAVVGVRLGQGIWVLFLACGV